MEEPKPETLATGEGGRDRGKTREKSIKKKRGFASDKSTG